MKKDKNTHINTIANDKMQSHEIKVFIKEVVKKNFGQYMIASTGRIEGKWVANFEKETKRKTYTDSEYIAGMLGGKVAVIGIAVQLAAYSYYFAWENHPEVFAIPIMTNIASVIYEKTTTSPPNPDLNRDIESFVNFYRRRG